MTKAQADIAVKAQEEADAKATEDPACNVVPEATDLQQSEQPVVEDRTLTGAAGAEQMEPGAGRGRPHHPGGGGDSACARCWRAGW